MKKAFLHLSMLVFLFSCSKTPHDFENSKLKTGLTKNEMLELEFKYAGLKFNNNTSNILNSEKDTLYFADSLHHRLIIQKIPAIFKAKLEVAHFIDSLNRLLTTSLQTSEIILNVDEIDTSTNASITSNRITQMQCIGNLKANNILSGGAFSSFTASFTYDGTNVSNFSISLMGTTIGWWWNSGSTFTNGLSGTTEGTATYFYGLFTYSTPYKLTWNFNPATCAVTYSWSCEVIKPGIDQGIPKKTNIIFPSNLTKDTTKRKIIIPIRPLKIL